MLFRSRWNASLSLYSNSYLRFALLLGSAPLSQFTKLSDQNRLARFVIDECHCCCTWGHDFREDYTKLGRLKATFPKVPVLALTATAPKPVLDDVINILKLDKPSVHKSELKRANLRYSIKSKDSDAAGQIHEYICQNHLGQSGIIYTLSRNDADTLSSKLRNLGIAAQSYHSEVSSSEKKGIHEDWMSGKVQVVVATIAFGLGINKR